MISVTARGINETMANLVRLERELPSALERGISKASILTRREVTLQLTGYRPPPPFLGVRTGAARSHITPGGRVFRSGSTLFSVVGSPDWYVKMHNDGAVFMRTSSRGKVFSVTFPARRMFETVRDRVASAVNALVGGEVSVVTRKANNG